MDWTYLFTSFDGRINRGKYWAGIIVLWILIGLVTGILAAILGAETTAYVVLYVVAIVAWVVSSLAIQVKRWHDREKSGWWVLIALIPIIGPIWAIIETGFLRGTDGPNRYGADPLQESAA